MRRVALLAVLALALPTAALANTVDYAGSGLATLSYSLKSGGFVDMTFSQLSVNGSSFAKGTVNLDPTLGASCGKGCYDITGGTVNISNGGGVLFKGTFLSGTVTYTHQLIKGVHYLNVNIQGFLANGSTVATVLEIGPHTFLGSSNTVATVAPEPGTLGLLGTGLIGLAGIVRRKFRA